MRQKDYNREQGEPAAHLVIFFQKTINLSNHFFLNRSLALLNTFFTFSAFF